MEGIGPALRSEGPAGRLVRALGLGVGDRVEGAVLSDLGGGRFEIALGGRVLRVRSPAGLSPGEVLALAVRQVSGRLLLEILEHRPGPPPDAPASLPAGEVPSRQVTDWLAAGGRKPEPALVAAILAAMRGAPLEEAAAERLPQGATWTAPGAAAISEAIATLEMELVRRLAGDPELVALDRAIARLGPVPQRARPLAVSGEEAARVLLAIPEGPKGDAEARRLTESWDAPAREAAATALARREREAIGARAWLAPLKQAHAALGRAAEAEAGRLLLGRDGVRYAEGFYRPPEGPPQRIRVSVRNEGRHQYGSGGRRGPLRVAVALDLPVLGPAMARLMSDPPALGASLLAERPESEALLREHAHELAEALTGLGFQASVRVERPAPGDPGAGFYEGLGIGAPAGPRVDLKA